MKVASKVTVSNQNLKHFGLDGEVTFINNTDNRAQVDLGVFGSWAFNYTDLQAIGGQNKPTEAIKIESSGIVSSENKTPVKRPYSKRSEKPKEVKQKRAYNRKKVD